MQQPPAPGLLRVLGPWMATALVIGTVIGSGVFKKPYAVSLQVTEFGLAMLAWVLVGLLALLGSLALAEIAVLMPRAGGNYVFLREGFGRWAGFLYGWVEFWIIRSGSIAALASVFTESLHAVVRGLLTDGTQPVLPIVGEQIITVTVIFALALVNARGTTWGGMLQLIVTTVKVLSLVAIAVMPFVFFFIATSSEGGPSAENLSPIWPDDASAIDWSKFGAAMLAAIWAYHGWMNIAPVAEEVRNPGRNIPLALIVGTLTVIALYLSANLAYYLVVPRSEMTTAGKDTSVAALFSFHLLGSAGLMFASAAVMTSVFGSLNGNLLVGPRLLYAMGKDRLAPETLAGLHPQYHTPARAVMVLAGWSILLVVGVSLLVNFPLPVIPIGEDREININVKPGAGPFDVLTDYAMFGAVAFETLAVATLFAFRRRFPKETYAAPYRCPFYPVLPIVYVLVMAAVLANMFIKNQAESFFAVGFIGVGALIYLFLPRPPSESAAKPG